MMQQGKVIVRRRLLMDLDRLRELGHHWGKGLLVVEPLGKQMHTHTRHLGCDPDDFCARGHRPITVSATRAALRTIEPPGGSPPIDMAQVHRNRQLPLGDLIEQHPARALWLLLEQAPQQSLLNFTELSSRTKRWTRNLSEVILLQGEWHGFILLEQDFRMKSVHSLLQVNAHFYPQQNQLIRNKISKPCRKRVDAVCRKLHTAPSLQRILSDSSTPSQSCPSRTGASDTDAYGDNLLISSALAQQQHRPPWRAIVVFSPMRGHQWAPQAKEAEAMGNRVRRGGKRAASVRARALVGIIAVLAVAVPAAMATDPRDTRDTLERYARDTWASFVAMTDAVTGLPADSLHLDGTRSVQTSITNIGAYLWSTLVAEALGFVSHDEAVARLDRTLCTLETMDR